MGLAVFLTAHAKMPMVRGSIFDTCEIALGGVFQGDGSNCQSPDVCAAVCTPCPYGDITSAIACVPNCMGDRAAVDFDDIVCALNGFTNAADCPCADVFGEGATPCEPNGTINFDDVLAILDAFAGVFACPNPCIPLDCNGVPNGPAVADCAGVCDGTAVADCFGVCDGGAVEDCAGVCGGNAFLDENGGCCTFADLDCADICYGEAQWGAGGICCLISDMDDCDMCNGDGTGLVGCLGDCANVGVCECDICNCPEPFFGLACSCVELGIQYNGLFQSSFIAPTSDTLMSDTLSAEAWIYPTKVGTPIMTRIGPSGTIWGLATGIVGHSLSENRIHLYNGQTCATCDAYGNTPIMINTWTHIMFTWSAVEGTAKFYVDGVFDGEQPFMPGTAGAGQLQIGAEYSTYFGGQMDDIRMWRNVRSASEIATYWDESISGVCDTNLIFNHNMQKWTAGDAACVDYSMHHNDLVHNLFPNPVSLIYPAPDPITPEDCPSNCQGAGTCMCGVCSCNVSTDTSFDCSISAGGC